MIIQADDEGKRAIMMLVDAGIRSGAFSSLQAANQVPLSIRPIPQTSETEAKDERLQE